MNNLFIKDLNVNNITNKNINSINATIANLNTNTNTNSATISNLNVQNITSTNITSTNLIVSNENITNITSTILYSTNTNNTNLTLSNYNITNSNITNITTTRLNTTSLSIGQSGTTNMTWSFSGTIVSTSRAVVNWIKIGSQLILAGCINANVISNGAGVTITLPNSFTHTLGTNAPVPGTTNAWFGGNTTLDSRIETISGNTQIALYFVIASGTYPIYVGFIAFINVN